METSHRSVVFQSPRFESTLQKDTDKVQQQNKEKKSVSKERRQSTQINNEEPKKKEEKVPNFIQMQKLSLFGQESESVPGSQHDKYLTKIQNLRKKKDKLKLLMRPQSGKNLPKLCRTVEFGHEMTVTYKRHSVGQVKEVLFNENIQSFISYNDKQIHVWTKDSAEPFATVNLFEETGSHFISCLVYSKQHMLYLVISTDFKMHIFNEHLLHVGCFPLNVRLIYFAYFFEQKSMLITAGIDGVFMFKFNVKNKYDPKQGIMLDPEGRHLSAELGPQIKLEKMPCWVKGLKVNEKQNIIFSWSQTQLCLNDLDGKLLFRYKKLTDYADHITAIFLSEFYRYFVTSTLSGQVIVWKLKKKKEVIHNFLSHQKTVTALQEIRNQPTLFLSASNDCTIRIFSLDKFQELYCFILPAGIHGIQLLNDKTFACYFQNQINIGQLHHLVQNFYNSQIEVLKIVKVFDNEQVKILNQPSRIMTLFSDNSIQVQKASNNDRSIISTIFPPPGAKEIMFYQYCMNLDRVFVILVDGTLCIYKFEDTNQSYLERIINKSEIKDSNKKGLTSQNITAASFFQTIPSKFDSDIYVGSEGTGQSQALLEAEYQFQKNQISSVNKCDRFLALGLSKGTVVFVEVENPDRIYARLSFHADAIQHLVELPYHKKFISICSQYNICVWGFQDHRPQQLSFSQMFRRVDQITVLQAYPTLSQQEILQQTDPENEEKKVPDALVLMSFDFGDQQLFKYDDDLKDLIFLKTELNWEHDRMVLGTDILNNEKKLFATGSSDNYVKIWNMQKELVREIHFPERIYSVCFLNSNGDLLVGHLGKVSLITREDYAPDKHLNKFQPSLQNLKNFYERKSQLANTDFFILLKNKIDELKKQNEAVGILLPTSDNNKKFIINPLEQKQNSVEMERKLLILKQRKQENKLQAKVGQKDFNNPDQKQFDEETKKIMQIVEEQLSEDMSDSQETYSNSSKSIQEDEIKNKSKQKEVQQINQPQANANQISFNFQENLETSIPQNIIQQNSVKSPQKFSESVIQPNSIKKDQQKQQADKSPNPLQKKQKTDSKSTQNLLQNQAFTGQTSLLSSIALQPNQKPFLKKASFQNQVSIHHSQTKSTEQQVISQIDTTSNNYRQIQISNHRPDDQTVTTMSEAEELEILQMMDKKKVSMVEIDYSNVHFVSAIPRQVTEDNYRKAVQMQIHRNQYGSNKKISLDQRRIPMGGRKGSNGMTRRDFTFLRIQDNIEKFNDPQGVRLIKVIFDIDLEFEITKFQI